ncbi:galectin-4 [Gopherus evgoodei]|uniref:galectin-4 n=1 Tax=Gopherus evgoodei TaxID=1825980 RepID=UPI0011CF13A3|nr:galectin-4 [Gopherus evgoodei]
MAYVPAPGYQPVYNPPLPHAAPIAGGLRPGMSIYVQGTVPHHTKRFRVNFSCGPAKGADIALHFNPRFDSGDKIVFNSFQHGKWAKEEYKHEMPFRKGQHFEMVFSITPEGYRIMVNGAPCYEFRHRIPPERVQVVDVDGDLELQSLNVMGGGTMGGGGMYHPQPGMHGMQSNMPPPATSLPMMAGPASFHPQVPYVANFPGGLTSKKTVVVKGFVPQGAKSFCINFKMGYSKDIALHINPRLNERVVVRNSLLNGQWGAEERALPQNPFQPGQYFDLSIRCGNGRFKVFANGQPLFDYNHRFREFQKIDTLEINGDVVLSYVQF